MATFEKEYFKLARAFNKSNQKYEEEIKQLKQKTEKIKILCDNEKDMLIEKTEFFKSVKKELGIK